MKKRIATYIALFALIAAVCGLTQLFQFFVARPNRQLAELELTKEPVDPAIVREVCHRVLSTPWGNAHNAFIYLSSCGDDTSVPYLIRALRRQEPPDKDGLTVCTTAHCIAALRAITGQKFGFSPDEWTTWWKANQEKIESNSARQRTAREHRT